MAKKRCQKKYEFRPDPTGTSLLKKIHLTRQQRLGYLKWGLYSLLTLLALLVQDVVMSQFRFSGATTDLAVSAIVLIGIYEDMEKGGLFTLLAATFYWFSGSAPGPYVIAILTVLTVFISYFRQSFWLRGFGSTVLCGIVAIMVYEMAVFLIGIFQGLTIWDRVSVCMLTGLLSCAVMILMYPVVNRIAKIGGNSWKE